jgi:hypothetical protein
MAQIVDAAMDQFQQRGFTEAGRVRAHPVVSGLR